MASTNRAHADDATQTSSPSASPSTNASTRPGALSLAPPRNRERYDLLGEHGRGGLGRVSRALDRDLERQVAIKELLERGQVREMRFLREALITARLEHPGIVPVHEAGRWSDGTPFYAMKLVAGRPLRDLIAERPTVEERLGLLHHVIAVADAIAYAHDRHIIHRDLKPSNIIVGDFGETIVIDWGLAKDLGASVDDPTTSGEAPPHGDGLTNTGHVLGTPAYMPPEQARGERVDQRADVFAIGAMLWELCALERVPPADPAIRHRLLRAAHLDPDLIAILDRTLAADPQQRYPHAGALAADLKAFKSGARIAARNYSLFAMLAHWTRHHQRLALAVVAAMIVAAAGGALYVHNVTAERDRADRALARVEATQSDLALEHAELQLRSDPTAALATLRKYHGSDEMRHAELTAEANGRGAARSIVHPHNDMVWFLLHRADGSFISLGGDHRVQRTLGNSTITLAQDALYTPHQAYSVERDLLAYAAFPSGLSVLSLGDARPALTDPLSPIALAFSAHGDRVAAIDTHGHWKVWQLAPHPQVLHEGQQPNQTSVVFVDDDHLALYADHELTTRELPTGASHTVRLDVNDVAAVGAHLIVAANDGTLLSMSSTLTTIDKLRACDQAAQAIKVLPRRASVAVGCADGRVNLIHADPVTGALTAVDRFETKESMWLLAIDGDEHTIAAAGAHTIYVYNLEHHTMTQLTGQAARLSAVAEDASTILVGDVYGMVRVWDAPAQPAHLVAQLPENPFGLQVSPDGEQLAVFGLDPAVQLIHDVHGAAPTTIPLRGHTQMVYLVRFSPTGRTLVSSSPDGTARTWSTADGRPLRVFDAHHATVEDVAYLANGNEVASVGDDGHLFVWSADGTQTRTLFTHDQPLVAMMVVEPEDTFVVRDARGDIWAISAQGQARQVRTGDATDVTFMTTSRDGHLFAIGSANGEVTLYRTADWQIMRSLKFAGAIRWMNISPTNRDMLVASVDDTVHWISLDFFRRLPWQDFKTAVHDVAYDASGDLLSISTRDGGNWFFSSSQATWRYFQDHTVELRTTQFAPRGAQLFTIDRGGTLLTRSTAEIFHPPHPSTTHP